MSTTKKVLNWYYRITKKHTRLNIVSWIFFSTGYLVQNYLPPIIEGVLIQQLVDGSLTRDSLVMIGGGYIFIRVILAEALIRTGTIISGYAWTKSVRDIRQYCFDHLVHNRASFHANNFSGALVSKVTAFTGNNANINATLLYNLIPAVVAIIFVCVYSFIVSPLYAASVLMVMVLLSYYVYKRTQVRATLNRETARIRSRATGSIADSITNVFAVKAEAAEKKESETLFSQLSKMQTTQHKSFMYKQTKIDLVTSVVTNVITSGVLLVGAYFTLNGQLEIGILYTLIRITSLLTGEFFQFNNALKTFEQAISDAHEMVEILEQNEQEVDPEGSRDIQLGARPAITIDDVSFTYKDGDNNDVVLSSLDISIKRGESIGLIGSSGSGKSTLFKLLLGFEQPDTGSIRFDNVSKDVMTLSSLRKNITYVTQEPLLFHRTVAENIRYSNPDASLISIKNAAKKAYAHEFIMKLPKGYDTLVGERGIKLSGGQKQRVAIARAFLKKAPILLLDEATSALDSESESYIQKSLKTLMKGKTSIVIAHRLSTVQHLDKIIVMEDGRIVESGTHSELVKKRRGTYKKLWSHQTNGFIS